MNNKILEQLLAGLIIPSSAYERAERRYKDLGEWYGRKESKCASFGVKISPQGSFRIGTVNPPLDVSDDYDLDLGCRLENGLIHEEITQYDLKKLVGDELSAYRKSRGIQNQLEEKNRCWRLRYADELSFHMDIVPSIPNTSDQRTVLREQMVKFGLEQDLAIELVRFAGSITDKTDPNFRKISLRWRTSNSEGYARWFESRMKLSSMLLESRAHQMGVRSIQDLPPHNWDSPLQQVIKLLKRHRDQMFKNDPDGQPISIIITTLAARAYQGEVDIATTLERVLNDMHMYIASSGVRIPNPVNPAEDFADKWGRADLRHLRLEENFMIWLEQARADFLLVSTTSDVELILDYTTRKFAIALDIDTLKQSTGLEAALSTKVSSKKHIVIATPARPWRIR